MKLLYGLSMAIALVPTLWSQSTVSQLLQTAFTLQEQGHFPQVIEILPPLLKADSFPQNERGLIWSILAFAYQEEANFAQAQDCYERAINILSHDAEHAEDYATTLENYTNLSKDMGNLDEAIILEWSGRGLLCDLLLQEAWLADLKEDSNAALVRYQKSLALWRLKHGDEHMATGWCYVPLGQSAAKTGDLRLALDSLKSGTVILNHTGPKQPKVSPRRDSVWTRLRPVREPERRDHDSDPSSKELTFLYKNQCIHCRVTVAALR